MFPVRRRNLSGLSHPFRDGLRCILRQNHRGEPRMNRIHNMRFLAFILIAGCLPMIQMASPMKRFTLPITLQFAYMIQLLSYRLQH